MKDIVVKQGDKTIHAARVPETWEEITPRQLVRLAPLIYGKYRFFESRIYAVSILAGIKKKTLALMDPEQLSLIADETDFIFEVLKISRSKIKYAGLLAGPADGLKHCCLDEYGLADGYLRKFMETKKQRDLCMALACLYRPVFFPFSRLLTDVWIWWLRVFTSKKQRLAMALNFSALKNSLSERYPHIFAEGGTPDKFGMQGMLIDLAGSKFGTEKKVRSLNIHVAFAYLERLAVERQKAEMMRKNKRQSA